MTAPVDEARALLAAALEVDPATIPDQASMESVEAWTSVAHLRLILALEERLGAQISTDDALAIMELADVARLLQGARPA